MQLTRWTYINRDFAKESRPSKKDWCRLIKSQAVSGVIIEGEPLIDAALFYGRTTHDAPANNPPSVDLLD